VAVEEEARRRWEARALASRAAEFSRDRFAERMLDFVKHHV